MQIGILILIQAIVVVYQPEGFFFNWDLGFDFLYFANGTSWAL